jgi:hypothetical protein
MCGRVSDVEATPGDSTEFHVAYSSGGLGYTKNNGLSFKSVFDSGNSFMMWNAGFTKLVPVHDKAIQQRDNEIVLGTHGRSLYINKLDEVQKKAMKK